ncbi:hypothetical protein HJ590_10125 [Naumannella sp. ID2617S]|nr:hypothetical protein [Naumannella sp. ID2617S]
MDRSNRKDRVKRRIAPVWKFLGVAGLVSVAATGALVARNERQRRAYSAEEIRARLHERAAATAAPEETSQTLTQ